MRKLLFALIALVSLQLTAQEDPVSWSGEVIKLTDNEYELITTATMEPGWHINSQVILPEENSGPIPTSISFYDVEGKIELIGENKETGSYTAYSDIWEFNVYEFTDIAVFKQKIKVLDSDLEYIIASAFYQTCDDEMCLRPTDKGVSFKIKPDAVIPAGAFDIIEKYLDDDKEPIVAGAPDASSIKEKKNHENLATDTEKVKEEETKKKNNEELKDDTQGEDEDRSLWGIFIVAFLSGFAALLTPCVFPMIPLTVSFFTKQSANRAKGISNAILYGIFIIVIYVLLGTVVTAIFGSESLNQLSTNVYFNIAFFLILVVFAASFLGAFEITLPQSWANKADEKASKGGIAGIFFMALALAIVSFSCTGPIVGSLIVEAASKGGLAPVIGMFGFSLAIALPFALFAIFPGWMNSLPKSGGWLNTVKVVLGFLELALAFKFLSAADLVFQTHIIEREVFLAVWIAIFGGLSLYLLGKIRMPHDGPDSSISVGRLFLGLVVMTFTIYLIPGLWGAPLKLISGFPPPLNYAESPYGVGYTKLETNEEVPEGAHLAVHDIIAFHDYNEGLAYSKKVNKPILVDFTGWACVNCRKMEERVWSDPLILNMLKNDFILISLYVDDKNKLPEEEQYISEITGKKVRTIGDKWMEFQKNNYETAAQPLYVLKDKDGNDIDKPIAYTPDVEEYAAWLKKGLKK
ncbi:thiol:disulfide interchange protein DsbD [Nonlabens xylanidelens]|uniref:Thiol:disulfide interchange protein DsbD n=1 Tax=Nonlabens xylanidelens TaxID=191564 RepID=A0A2S6IGA8_9FLAO|nr:cytochrome c biogenesis protein CcdA [Nonlabens xylanidelens]PPK93255.1 thiol:disulfide interchange protein DsbD [Nonlabens xylanidelens]